MSAVSAEAIERRKVQNRLKTRLWRAKNKVVKTYPKVCKECSGTFLGTRPYSVYCSPKCDGKAAYKVRKNDPKRKAYAREYQRKRRINHPEGEILRRKKCIYKKRGTTIEEVNAKLLAQNNTCPICNAVFTEDSPPVVDHCHRVIKLRGLIHHNCNTLLGFAADSPEILRRAAEYLEKAYE